MQKYREYLSLALIALLPLHALLVTAATRLIVGPGHAPLPIVAVWKEGILGIILIITLIEIRQAAWSKTRLNWVKTLRSRMWKLRTGWFIQDEGFVKPWFMKGSVIDTLIIILVLLSLLIPSNNYALGFKYDFIPLIAFLILRRVPWSEWFMYKVQTLLIGVGVIISLYGILTHFLPTSFFVWLGYSDAHSLYIPGGPLAAFQQIGGEGIRRIQSTMSGPNQLGIWLLIPWSIGVVHLVRRQNALIELYAMCTAVIGLGIILTFSRSAWIAAALIALIAIGRNFDKKLIAYAGGAVIVAVIGIMIMWPAVFVRITSSRDHYLRPLAAIQSIIAHPLGQGLGSAGPASNRISDACVYLDAGADITWAKDRTDLCVFVDSKQVQPVIPCHCPFLPENWYLQIGVELGVLGLILYAALILIVLRKLLSSQAQSVFLMFLGISVAVMFLHAWEDAAVAYTGWIITATVLATRRPTSDAGPAK